MESQPYDSEKQINTRGQNDLSSQWHMQQQQILKTLSPANVNGREYIIKLLDLPNACEFAGKKD